MKVVKYLGIALVIFIVLVLVVAVFVPKTIQYEKTIAIKAPIDSVWKNVSTLAALDKWSPWNLYDANMKKESSGVDGTVGAIQSWESKVIGTGSQTIATVQKPTLFETKLDFYKPHESHGRAYIKLMTDGAGTSVTWGMTSNMPYPFNVMTLFMNVEKDMGKDWDRGLSMLKELSEK
jgi:Polyketide cyclase / dehydrase and lipid transport.